MKRSIATAALGLALLGGCPPPTAEDLPMDKVVIVERAIPPTPGVEPSSVPPRIKEQPIPEEDPAVKEEPRSPAPTTPPQTGESPEAPIPNPLGPPPPLVPGVAPVPAVPWPTQAAPAESPQAPASGKAEPDK